MFQIRDRDGRAYALGRDLAQLFPRIAGDACHLLGMGGWHPQLKAWAEHAGLTQEHLKQAEIALAKYIIISTTDKATEKRDAWVNSGLAALHPAAQVMIFFFVGTVTADRYLEGVREATKAGQTAHGAERLLDRVDRLVHATSTSSPRSARRRAAETAAAMDRVQSPNPFDN